MEKQRKNLVILLITMLFITFLSLLDFAALHDIRQDYVSSEILESLDVTLSQNLPDWTATAGEWGLVSFSLLMRFLASSVVIYLVIRLLLVENKSVKKGKIQPQKTI